MRKMVGWVGTVIVSGAFWFSAMQPVAALQEEGKSYNTADECATLQNDKLRLKCFDTVFSGSVFSQEAQKKAVKEDFGRERLKEDVKNRDDKGRLQIDADEIKVQIVKAKKSKRGKWIFTTSDGQVWQQTNTDFFSKSELPFNANIEKGFWSSYNFKKEGKDNFIKVKRVK